MQEHKNEWAKYEPAESEAKTLKSGSEDDSGTFLDEWRYGDVLVEFASEETDQHGNHDRLNDVVHRNPCFGQMEQAKRPFPGAPLILSIIS
jgi:hypothetical protein